MCGICGLIYRDPRQHPTTATLRAMADSIRHRGPDDEGIVELGQAGLGHRRLSIIDLSSAGHQPMANEDDTIWIVFNGEIYNFRQLRSSLKQAHHFRSNTDTEVLLHLYEEHGEQMVDLLDGMFALAIVDLTKQRVLLARDPFGIKPLYYSLDDRRLVFGSELKPLLASNEVERNLDLPAINDYFDFHWIAEPRSIFSTVRKLLPAHTLTLDLRSWHTEQRRYWSAQYRPEQGRTVESWTEEIEAELRRSVADQLVADVPVGTFLSGGIDSTLITHFAAESAQGRMKSFTIDFSSRAHSELESAREVAQKTSVEHVVERLEQDALGTLDEAAHWYDEPFADSSLLPTMAVSRLARQQVKVALSGDGGDELFSGYQHYQQGARLRPLDWIPQPINRLVFGGLGALSPAGSRVRNWGRRFSFSGTERRLSLIRLPGNASGQLLTKEFSEPLADRFWKLDAHLPELRGLPPITQMQLFDLLFYLPNDMLVKVDRASMAVGLEVRVPMLSRRIADLAFRIPEEIRFQYKNTKPLLRGIVGKLFGDSLEKKRKQGFGVPLTHWISATQNRAAQSRLLSSPIVAAGIVSMHGLKQLFASLETGATRWRADRSGELFAVLMFDAWWRRYMES